MGTTVIGSVGLVSRRGMPRCGADVEHRVCSKEDEGASRLWPSRLIHSVIGGYNRIPPSSTCRGLFSQHRGRSRSASYGVALHALCTTSSCRYIHPLLSVVMVGKGYPRFDAYCRVGFGFANETICSIRFE